MSKQMLARPEAQSCRYSFARLITLLFRRPGQRRSAWSSPSRTTLSSLAGRLNDGRLPDGEVVASLESEIRKLYEVGARRFRVALLPAEIHASREPGLPLNSQLGRIPAKMRAELTSAEIS